LEKTLAVKADAILACTRYLISNPRSLEFITIEELAAYNSRSNVLQWANDEELVDFLEQNFIIRLLLLLYEKDKAFYQENSSELLYAAEISKFH
jgi:hypothetical protein